jgi:hypothetical protein
MRLPHAKLERAGDQDHHHADRESERAAVSRLTFYETGPNIPANGTPPPNALARLSPITGSSRS